MKNRFRFMIPLSLCAAASSSSLANITVHSPSDGQQLRIGQSVTLSWSDDAPGDSGYTIRVSVDNGVSYHAVNDSPVTPTTFTWTIPALLADGEEKITMLTATGRFRIADVMNPDTYAEVSFSTMPQNPPSAVKNGLLHLCEKDSSTGQYEDADTVRILWTKCLDGQIPFPGMGSYSRNQNLMAYSTDLDTQLTVFDSATNYQHPMFCMDGKRFIYSNNDTRQFYIVNWNADNQFSDPVSLGFGHAACMWYDTLSGKEYVIYTLNGSLQGNYAVFKMDIDNPEDNTLLFNGNRSLTINSTWMCISADGQTVGDVGEWPHLTLYDISQSPPQLLISGYGMWPTMPYDYSNRILTFEANHHFWYVLDPRDGSKHQLTPQQIWTMSTTRLATYTRNFMCLTEGTGPIRPGRLWICKTDTGFTGVQGSVQIDSTATNSFADLWHNKNPLYLHYLEKHGLRIANFSMRSEQNNVQLTWKHNGTALYHIYRSTESATSGFELIDSTTGSGYLDTGLTKGMTFWYHVTGDGPCSTTVVANIIAGSGTAPAVSKKVPVGDSARTVTVRGLSPVDNSGFALLGSIKTNGGTPAAVLLALAADGSLRWHRQSGSCALGGGYANGVYACGGYVEETGVISAGYELTGETGTLISSRLYPNSGHPDRITDLVVLDDSSVVFCGNRGDDVVVMKEKRDGSISWMKVFSNPDRLAAHAIEKTPDGGFIVAGEAVRDPGTGTDAVLLKTDTLGNTQWLRYYGGAQDDAALDVKVCADGDGYVLCGGTFSFGNGGEDAFMLKTDLLGREMAHLTFGGSAEDFASGLYVCTNGSGYIACGNYRSGDPDSTVFLWKVSETKGTVWVKRLEGFITRDGKNVVETPLGGSVVAVNYSEGDTASELVWVGSEVVKVEAGEGQSLF